MRISDWSSDVCSSDLCDRRLALGDPYPLVGAANRRRRTRSRSLWPGGRPRPGGPGRLSFLDRRLWGYRRRLGRRERPDRRPTYRPERRRLGLGAIGSTAWREMVCRYLTYLVVA